MNIDKVFIEWHNYPNMACYNDVSCNSTVKVIELTGCVWKGKIKKNYIKISFFFYTNHCRRGGRKPPWKLGAVAAPRLRRCCRG